MSPQPIPPGYHSVTPYLIVRGAEQALAFYQAAFGAEMVLRLDAPDGSVVHAEFRIGDSIVMLSEEHPAYQCHGPAHFGGSPVNLMVYTPDVDALFAQALAAGAKELRPVKDQFYGDRSGAVIDPLGHTWVLATHKEDLSQAEIERRFAEMLAAPPPS